MTVRRRRSVLRKVLSLSMWVKCQCARSRLLTYIPMWLIGCIGNKVVLSLGPRRNWGFLGVVCERVKPIGNLSSIRWSMMILIEHVVMIVVVSVKRLEEIGGTIILESRANDDEIKKRVRKQDVFKSNTFRPGPLMNVFLARR